MSEACTLMFPVREFICNRGNRICPPPKNASSFCCFPGNTSELRGRAKKHGTRWEPVPTVSKYPASIFATTSFADTLPHKWRVQDPRRERQNALKKKRFHEWSLEECAIGALCKGIRILDSRKCLLVDRKLESGKIVLAEYGIRNAVQGVRNPSNDWNPESKFH